MRIEKPRPSDNCCIYRPLGVWRKPGPSTWGTGDVLVEGLEVNDIESHNITGKTSTVAVIITSLYLLSVAASFLIMLMTADDTAMSGIFLVLATLPWSILLTWLQDTFQFNSMVFNGLFLVAGGVLNSFILYKIISFIAGRFRR